MNEKVPTIPDGVILITDLPMGGLSAPMARVIYRSPGRLYEAEYDMPLHKASMHSSMASYTATRALINRMLAKVGGRSVGVFYNELCNWDPRA